MTASFTDRIKGALSSLAIKAPCVAVATTNITLSGEQTVGGVAVTEGDRVLVVGQTDATENGIYDGSTSAWSRSPDFDGPGDIVRGTMIPVSRSSGSASLYEVTTSGPITIGTSDIAFTERYGANATYDITPRESAAGVTIVDDSEPEGYVTRYGMSTLNTAAANDAALAAAVSVAVDLVFPAGDYTVTDFTSSIPAEGTVWSGLGRLVTGTSHRRTWEFGGPRTTSRSITFFVNATAGDDSDDGLTSGAAFRTLNRALQQVPMLIKFGHVVVIFLEDGVHNASDIPASDMPRAAIGYVTGIYGGERSSESGGDLTGSLVIRGESQAGTIIECGSDYDYGIYCSQIPNVGVEDLTIRGDGVNTAAALLVGHRGCYVQANNVTIDGQGDATYGVLAEAGGIVEFIGAGVVQDCGISFGPFDGSIIVLSNDVSESGASVSAISARGIILINNEVSMTSAISTEGTVIISRGASTGTRVTMPGDITMINGSLRAVWTNFAGNGSDIIDLDNCETQLNVCSWSDRIIGRSGHIRLRGATTSYISPASVSNAAEPLSLLNDCIPYIDQAVIINGSGGINYATRGALTQAISANSSVINFQGQMGRHMQTELTANGSYTGCTLAAVSSDFSRPPNEGDLLTVSFNGANDVEIVNGSTADVSGGSVTLGQGVGDFNSATFMWLSSGSWMHIGSPPAN